MNFHPFYRNPTEVVKKEEFQVNYSSNTLQDDIFAQKRQNLKLVNLILIFHNCHDHSIYSGTSDSGPSEIGTQYIRPHYKGHRLWSPKFCFPIVFEPP